MKKLISCEYNLDTACVELKFDDRSMISKGGRREAESEGSQIDG